MIKRQSTMYNRQFTATHKEHLSQSHRGTHHSQETKQKISQSVKNRWNQTPPQPATQPTRPTAPTKVTTDPQQKGTK